MVKSRDRGADSRPLFVVEEHFSIHGIGLALVGFTADQYAIFKENPTIELKRPDGSVLRTDVIGADYPPSVKWVEGRPENSRYGLFISPVLTEDDAPLGTEVRLCKDDAVDQASSAGPFSVR